MQPFNRPPRFRLPQIEGTIQVPGPPSDDDKETPPVWQMMLPMMGMVVMALMYLGVSRYRGYGGMLFVLPMLAMSVIMLISTLVMSHLQKRRAEREKLEASKRFLRLLYRREASLMAGHTLQQHYAYEENPDVETLYQTVRRQLPDLWLRHPGDDDFLAVRVGIGRMESQVLIEGPDADEETDWLLEARRVAETYREIDQMPLLIDLKRTGSIGVVGTQADRMAFMGAFLARLAVQHAPSELILYVVGHLDDYNDWKWVRWLPHVSANQEGGGAERIGFTRRRVRQVMSVLSMELEKRLNASEGRQTASGPQIILVCDRHELIQDERAYSAILQQGRAMGAQAIFLEDALKDVPDHCGAVVELQNGSVQIKTINGQTWRGLADRLPAADANALMRRMAPVFMPGLGMSILIPQSVNFLEMLSAVDLQELAISQRWHHLPSSDPNLPRHEKLPRPVPIGSAAPTSPTYIHLAENEHGPHGMIAGTTGSGKSELLQTLVASLAAEHHPYLLNFLLLDYKGGATFRMFEQLPHTVGMFSNLESADLAWRVLEGIKAEIHRRERFLQEYGVEDIVEYHQKTLKGKTFFPRNYEPLPHLLIIVDEFAQLARKESNYIPELVSTVQVGRSLGIHLILATQSPEGVVTDDMLANLNFKICLRVQDVENSRAILKRPDAAYLPHDIPGRAYFQVGNSTPQLFQVARVGVEYTPGTQFSGANEQQLSMVDFEEYTELTRDTETGTNDTLKLAEQLVDHMLEIAGSMSMQPMRSPVLPQLPAHLSIAHLWGQSAAERDHNTEREYTGGWDGGTWRPRAHDDHYLAAPVGRLDDLTAGTQEIYWHSFSQMGNLLVVGAPQMGKSFFLLTLFTNLMRLHRPDELQIYALGFGGNSLKCLEAFPHVGSIISSGDQERTLRLLRELHQQYDARRAMTEQDLTRLPAIILAIDNLGNFRTLFDEQYNDLRVLVDNGRQYGIYVVLTANSASDVGYRITSTIAQRMCFPVAEKIDYNEIVGKPQGLSLADIPGRCFVRMGDSAPPMQTHIAYPGSLLNQPFEAELHDLAEQMDQAWEAKSKARAIGILPQVLTFKQLHAETQQQPVRARVPHVALGYADHDLAPYWLNLADDGAHYIVAGTSQSGKTASLQTLCLAVAHYHHPEDAHLLILDPLGQKSWRAFGTLPHTLRVTDNPDDFHEQVEYLKGELHHRRQISHAQRQDDAAETAGRFPALIVVIDDFELVSSSPDYAAALEELALAVRKDRNLDFYVWVAGSAEPLQRALNSNLLLREMQMRRTGVALGHADSLNVIGARVPRGLGDGHFPPGRGYLRIRSQLVLLHFAYCEQPQLLHDHWNQANKAAWQAAPLPLGTQKAAAAPAPDETPDMEENWFNLDDAAFQEAYWKQRASLNPEARSIADTEESENSDGA